MGMQTRSLFNKIREAQKLYHLQDYTRAFNMLSDVEKKTDNLHLKTKIANLKIQCLFQVGNVKSAVEYIEELTSIYPLSGQINFLAASVYRKLGDLIKAGRLYLRSVCLYPENTQYALVYSQFLKESNRTSEAIGIIRNSLKKQKEIGGSDSGTYFLYLELALSYYLMGYFSRSLVFFTKCASSSKNFPYYDLISEIYLKKNEPQKAKNFIEKHLNYWGEGDPDALFIYAKVLVSLNDKANAIKYLRKCEKLWGELVVTSGDMTHLFPLLQDGSLKKIKNLVLEL